MKKELQTYLKVYNNFLSKEICDNTITELQNKHFEQHKFYNPVKNTIADRSGDKELDITYDKVSTNKIIMDKIWHALHSYIEELNFEWWGGWSGYSEIRFNRYSETKKMAEHCDHIHSLFQGDRKGIPILSCLGILNDNYEGGELVFFEDTTIKTKQGDLLIFPSNFLYPHRVEPVKNGNRWSYISWVW